jgi:N-methylhydantoinase B/oxoprolinase/acetone carboxylase alpha subunit
VHLASGAPFRPAGRQPIPAGDSLIVETPGGGGFGQPSGRAPERVAEDIRRGLVTPAAALRDYGLMLDRSGSPEGGAAVTLSERASSPVRAAPRGRDLL